MFSRTNAASTLVLVLTVHVGLADEQSATRRARELLRLFLGGQYAAFVGAGTDEVKAGFKPEQAEQVHRAFQAQLGAYQTEASATYERVAALDSVTFALRFERGVLKLQVVVDEQGRLAGFWVRGVEAAKEYEPPEYVDRDAFREEKVTIRCGEFELPGTLSIPAARARHPAVVLVHGSGPHDEDETVMAHKPFRDLGWGLASAGVATLRYEKRTHKYGAQMKPDQTTLDEETIDDAAAAVKLLRQRPEIDPQRVYVLGHSLGGTAAPFVAAREPDLAGIVILAGMARSPMDVIPDQVEYLARLDGRIDDDERQSLDDIRQATEAIRAAKPDEVRVPLLGAPTSYWMDLHRRDPVAAAARLRCPILVIQGGRDYQVTMKCYETWQRGLKGRAGVTCRLYEKLNHLMTAGEGPSDPKEYSDPGHVDAQVVRDIATWIRSGGKLP